jgi:transcriptional regulator with XRE-family HTH domain
MTSPAADAALRLSAGLGLAVRAARHDAGMTVLELADLSGLDAGYLARAENGLHEVTCEALLRLSRALGTSSDALLEAAERNTLAEAG